MDHEYPLTFSIDNQELCIPPGASEHASRFLLARQAVKEHLKLTLPHSLPSVKVHEFGSAYSEEFSAFLKESEVAFFMVHDGALPTRGKVVQENASETRAKIILRCLISWLNSQSYNVVLLNHNEYKDTKVSSNDRHCKMARLIPPADHYHDP